MVADELRVIANASDNLKEGAETYVDATSVEGFVEELLTLVQGLRDVDDEVNKRFAEIDAGSSALSRDAHALSSEISFHDDIAAELEDIRREFVQWGRDSRAIAPQRQGENESRLKAMLERYTMEAERQVHESAFTQRDSGEVMAEEVSASSLQGNGDGPDAGEWDNVELF